MSMLACDVADVKCRLVKRCSSLGLGARQRRLPFLGIVAMHVLGRIEILRREETVRRGNGRRDDLTILLIGRWDSGRIRPKLDLQPATRVMNRIFGIDIAVEADRKSTRLNSSH